ncbi:hypothetical protein F4818DRAFT_450992 [Hypoxylon cercidicola]|nr:hypothetical protein F4818DRAFT_450992 [Hypoxylon cercidicola]
MSLMMRPKQRDHYTTQPSEDQYTTQPTEINDFPIQSKQGNKVTMQPKEGNKSTSQSSKGRQFDMQPNDGTQYTTQPDCNHFAMQSSESTESTTQSKQGDEFTMGPTQGNQFATQYPQVAAGLVNLRQPDSAVALSFDACVNFETADASVEVSETAESDPMLATVTIEHHGSSVEYTLGQVMEMRAVLAKARADGLFPTTKAAHGDMKATSQDYFNLVLLNHVRDLYPREEWNKQRAVVDLLIRITRDIRARDKVAAEKTEEERVKAHVSNMMSGVGAEAKLYNIVQHAVTYAAKNGSSDQAATITGQNMAELLNGIRAVIKAMSGKGTHGVTDHNVESVLEEVFGMIDFALGNVTDPLHKDVQDLGGHVKDMHGEIVHLNAIGQHVNAIDHHVHSLGNNVNSFGTLLNSTNGNVVSMTTQIALLQTIVNMLPQMIAENLQQRIPEVLIAALGPLMQEIEAHLNGVSPSGFSFSGTSNNNARKGKGISRLWKKLSSGVKKVFQ